MNTALPHQYIDRQTQSVCTEKLYSDRIIRFIYDEAREHAPAVFRALTSSWVCHALGFLNYDLALGARLSGNSNFLKEAGVNLEECLEPVHTLTTARRVFERKIRYWECRPMPLDPAVVVSPADSRMIVGSLSEGSKFFIKHKFFAFEELLEREQWIEKFQGGDFALFRLTPDKYHYNHMPVSGRVRDIYAIDGHFHSCNPSAVVTLVTPHSKNRRVVTVIDTDVPGGTGVGLVAMVEVVALMIGDIAQTYSDEKYDSPSRVFPGMFLRRGQPKSLFRPGSSTDVLLFQPGRVTFDADLLRNMHRPGVLSRFSHGFGQPIVESDVPVRASIGHATSPSGE